MKTYSANFQQFPTGFWILAAYKRKQLTLEMQDTFESWMGLYEERPSEEEIKQMKKGYKEAEEWTKQHTGKRFETVDEVETFLKDMHNDVDFDC